MLKAGVIGCGRIASTFDDDPRRTYPATHIGAYRRFRQTEVVAVCDPDEARLQTCQKRWGIERGFTDLDAFCRDVQPDIVSVCTPPATHEAVIKKILKVPSVRAVFCEKPIAHSTASGQRIVEMCQKRGVLLQIDHQRRFDPLHQKLQAMIAAEKYGKVQAVNFYYTAGIANTGSHMFDLLRMFFGDIRWIEGMYSGCVTEQPPDPLVDGLVRFESGTLATFQAGNVKNFLIFEMRCAFEKARFVLKNSGFGLEFERVAASRYFSGYRELTAAAKPFRDDYQRNFMVEAVRHLVHCLKTNSTSHSSGTDGLAALVAVKAAEQSAARDGRRIYLR